MTTGRINQIAFPSRYPSGAAYPVGSATPGKISTPQERGEKVTHQWKDRISPQREPRWSAGQNPSSVLEVFRRLFLLPPLSSPEDGPPQRARCHALGALDRDCGIRLQEEEDERGTQIAEPAHALPPGI